MSVAMSIIAYREENGRFYSRQELLQVPKLGPKTFEQSAGFMRIRDGENPLDATGVHPESYKATEGLLEMLDLTMDDIKEIQRKVLKQNKSNTIDKKKIKKDRKPAIKVKNQNTAFGKALMEAVNEGSQDMEVKEDREVSYSLLLLVE